VHEEIVRFGDAGQLTGIVSLSPTAAGKERVACLFPNVGLAHRIGPHRLNVRLARALAGAGLTAMRFDLSGIGDSSAVGSQGNYLDQAVLDMQAAMTALETQFGIRHFVVFGICSGAVNAYRLAKADSRVRGILMLDGFTYPSKRAKISDFLGRLRLLSASQMPAFAAHVFKRLKRRIKPPPVSSIDASINVVMPPMAEFDRDMSQLIARGVNIYCVFTGSMQVTTGNLDQLSAFGNAPFISQIRCEYWPDVDHTATALYSQKQLSAALCQWAAGIAPAS
jgi:hypothetical protein